MQPRRLRRRRPPGTESGFTLLEVLAAFVVFAIALAGVLEVFAGGLRDAQLADEFARATQVAQSRLALASAVERLAEGASSGTEDGFAWEVAVTAYDERGENPDIDPNKNYGVRVRLMRIESRVAWHAADGRDRDLRLATLALAVPQ